MAGVLLARRECFPIDNPNLFSPCGHYQDASLRIVVAVLYSES